jgi:hypothetical protein
MSRMRTHLILKGIGVVDIVEGHILNLTQVTRANESTKRYVVHQQSICIVEGPWTTPHLLLRMRFIKKIRFMRFVGAFMGMLS